MSNQAQPLAAETQAIREAYAALNRGDIPGFVSVLDPQVERIESADFPMGGTYRGLAAVTAHLSKARGTWAEGSCEPQRFIVAGDRLIVLVDVRVRLQHETDWRIGRIADVFTFGNGKAIGFRTFGEEREAFEWAGVEGLPDTDWPFDQPRNCATLTLRSIVFDGAPILYVSHDADDHGWQFLDGKPIDTANAALLGLGEIVRRDPSVLDLADMPPGWSATRETKDLPWRRVPPDGG